MIVTIDMVCLRLAPTGIQTLLVKRSNPNRPDCGQWALPGGLVYDEDMTASGGEPADEDFDSARRRICRQKIHTYPNFISDPLVDGNPKRDPDGWSVSISHYALLNPSNVQQIEDGGIDRDRANWFSLTMLLNNEMELAFDHVAQIQHAWKKLRAAVEYTSVVLFSLEKEFLVADIIEAYTKFGVEMNRMTVKRRLINTGVIVSANKIAASCKGKGGKPATVYRLANHEVTYFQTCLRG
ncbi:NUDIX hydrolase [Vibrio cincinnatiensis]|uniref:NUDIX hydrolase n=1 Tax=Vibrio cincinnatiensis TaxID=675 RepID=UPI001EDD4D97|nr:NUDIX hydrolase [Vibrio cincinnatiensis]MCG3760523.1 NUDIX hydrolase [Vibrio cincinnatiensis]MCG3763833.1 NUDIX hydrolase [Vibrio cincinnatiensis]